MVTINSQQPDSPGNREDLDRRVVRFLNEVDKFIQINEGYEDDTDKEINCEYELETGGKQHRLHAHCTIAIYHETNLRINYSMIAAWSRQYAYNTNVRFLAPQGEEREILKARNYVKKDQAKKGKKKEE